MQEPAMKEKTTFTPQMPQSEVEKILNRLKRQKFVLDVDGPRIYLSHMDKCVLITGDMNEVVEKIGEILRQEV